MPKTLKWFIKRAYETMGSFTVLNEPYQKVFHTNAKMTQIEFHTNSQENLKKHSQQTIELRHAYTLIPHM